MCFKFKSNYMNSTGCIAADWKSCWTCPKIHVARQRNIRNRDRRGHSKIHRKDNRCDSHVIVVFSNKITALPVVSVDVDAEVDVGEKHARHGIDRLGASVEPQDAHVDWRRRRDVVIEDIFDDELSGRFDKVSRSKHEASLAPGDGFHRDVAEDDGGGEGACIVTIPN